MFKHKKFYKALEKEISSSQSFETSMKKMLDWGEAAIPHRSWQELRALDLSKEQARIAPWIKRVLTRSPAPFPIRGLYFGLGEFANSAGIEYADLYFGLMGQCDHSDTRCRWLWEEPRHYPENAYLKSKPLKAAGLICYQDEENGLSTEGQEIFCLSFSTLLLKHGLTGKIYSVLSGANSIAVVTGFDSGDLIRLGSLGPDGLTVGQGPFICG